MSVELSSEIFPLKVRYMEEEIVLYAEPDRRRITYRETLPDGRQSKKKKIPKGLGDDGLRPASPHGYRAGKEGQQIPTYQVPALAIEWAEGRCQQLADERRGIAAELAAKSASPNQVSLGYVFARVRESVWYFKLSGSRLDEVSRTMRWVETQLGSGFDLSMWDADVQAGLHEKRQKGVRSTSPEGHPTFLAPSGRNTAVRELRVLKTIFKRAVSLKYRAGTTRHLLDSNPMEKYDLPSFAARRRREVVDAERYAIVLKYADEVDPSGRFRFFLVLLRYLGERVSTVRNLLVGSLLFEASDIRRAFELQLCNYIPTSKIRKKAADLYARNGGAVFYRYEMRKPAKSGNERHVEQYDAVVPIHPEIKKEFASFREKFIKPRGLGREAPLIPGERLDKPVSSRQVNLWWHEAIRAAEKGEERNDLALEKGNAFHGLRINRRTELRKVETKYARWIVGHSVQPGNGGLEVSEGVYLGLKPRELAAAVLLTDDGEDDEEW